MNSILILLTLAALSGFVAGRNYFSWPALIVAGVVLAPLAAVVLQQQSFDALGGISIVFGCLVVNQGAYLMAIRLNADPKGGAVGDLSEKETNSVPRNDRDEDIRQKDKGNQNPHLDLPEFASWRADLVP
jgi:hypothetical protein